MPWLRETSSGVGAGRPGAFKNTFIAFIFKPYGGLVSVGPEVSDESCCTGLALGQSGVLVGQFWGVSISPGAVWILVGLLVLNNL